MPRKRRVVVGAAAGIAVVLVGGGLAIAATNSSAGSYRTATVQPETVRETVALSGSVASTTVRTAAFGVAGTVATVSVQPGQQVHAGDALASLSTTGLDSQLQTAQQNASNAAQTLSDDLASQTATTSTASTSSGSGGGSGSSRTTSSPSTGTAPSTRTTPTGSASGTGTGSGATKSGGSGGSTSSPAITHDVAAVHAAQKTLLSDASTSAADLAAAQSAETAESTTCTAVMNATISDPSATPSPSPTATAAPTPTPTATPAPSSGSSLSTVQAELAACQTALATVQTDQQKTATAQKVVQQDATALDAAVSKLQSDLATASAASATGGSAASGSAPASSGSPASAATTTTTSTGSSPLSAPGSGGSASPGSAGGSSAPATAETIVADQAAVTAANAAVAMAQQNVSLGTLTSPIDGVVAAVSLTPGANVSAGTRTSDITIIGSSGWSVNATVPVTHVGALKIGQRAAVTVAGAPGTLSGSVSAIGVTDVSSDAANPAYSVTVGLDDANAHLLNGAPAQATISIASATNVLAVPSSAIHRAGSTTIVDKLVNGTPAPTRVTVGSSGGDFTQITSGLAAGDVVELADLSQPLPSTTTTGFGGAGRFGGTGVGRGAGAGGAGASGSAARSTSNGRTGG